MGGVDPRGPIRAEALRLGFHAVGFARAELGPEVRERLAAFLEAGLVDEVVTYVAPMLLGGGRNAVADLGIATIADALHLQVDDVTVIGTGAETNVRLTMRPPHPEGDR